MWPFVHEVVVPDSLASEGLAPEPREGAAARRAAAGRTAFITVGAGGIELLP